MKTKIQVCKDLINLLVGKYNEIDCIDEQGMPHALQVFVSRAKLYADENGSATVYFGCKDDKHCYALEYTDDTFILFSVDEKSPDSFNWE